MSLFLVFSPSLSLSFSLSLSLSLFLSHSLSLSLSLSLSFSREIKSYFSACPWQEAVSIKRERERMCVCVWVERKCVCVCVCVCVCISPSLGKDVSSSIFSVDRLPSSKSSQSYNKLSASIFALEKETLYFTFKFLSNCWFCLKVLWWMPNGPGLILWSHIGIIITLFQSLKLCGCARNETKWSSK